MPSRHASALAILCLMAMPICTSAYEFKVDFVKKPAEIGFNTFLNLFEVTLDLKISTGSAGRRMRVYKLALKLGPFLSNPDLNVVARVNDSGTAGQLVIQCKTFTRCFNRLQLFRGRPWLIQRVVKFYPRVYRNGQQLQLPPVSSAESPAYGDVVFQKRVDNSVSFAQNWETYVRGFVDGAGNYWMGLDELALATQSGKCQLSLQGLTFDGAWKYAKYKRFVVRGASENYKLLIGEEEPGSQIGYMTGLSNSQFSTYDRDNDRHGLSCSRDYSQNTGWWFSDCGSENLNGDIVDMLYLPNYQHRWMCRRYCFALDRTEDEVICLKRTLMSFKCG